MRRPAKLGENYKAIAAKLLKATLALTVLFCGGLGSTDGARTDIRKRA
jgi:hypothetical protein